MGMTHSERVRYVCGAMPKWLSRMFSTPDFSPEKNADQRMTTARPGSIFGRYATVRKKLLLRTVSPISSASTIGRKKPSSSDQNVYENVFVSACRKSSLPMTLM